MITRKSEREIEAMKESGALLASIHEQLRDYIKPGLTGLDTDILKMESYIFVDPNSKTKGLGKKTLFLQCIYAFEILRIKKIYAYIDSDNFASQNLYEKIGFKKEGVLRFETKRENKLIDRYYYGCLINDLNEKLFQYQVSHENKEIILL